MKKWAQEHPGLATVLGVTFILGIVAFVIWLFSDSKSDTTSGNSETASNNADNASGKRQAGDKLPWAGCTDISYGNSLDYISAKNITTVYNADYTVYKQALVNDPIGALVRKVCEWYVVGTPAGEKYVLVADSKFDSGLPRNNSNIPLLENDQIRFVPYLESEVLVFTHPRNPNLKIAVKKTEVDKYRVYTKGDPTQACACSVDGLTGDEFMFMDTTICIPGCEVKDQGRRSRYNDGHGPTILPSGPIGGGGNERVAPNRGTGKA